jgi:hypothetical protein
MDFIEAVEIVVCFSILGGIIGGLICWYLDIGD